MPVAMPRRPQGLFLEFDLNHDMTSHKNECLNIAGFEIMPTKRAATYEKNIEQKELIQTVTSKKSSIVTPKTYALTMTQKEVDNIKRIAEEKKIRLFKLIKCAPYMTLF